MSNPNEREAAIKELRTNSPSNSLTRGHDAKVRAT